jgi:hypothetical protein
MSSELERRLEGMLAEIPEPGPGVGEEALERALHVLRPGAPPRRGLRAAALAFATAVVLLVIAAGSLAAAGALHVSFGAKKAKPHPAASTQLTLPKGADGIAAIVDGRLSVVIKGGFRLQGLSATAAALSPHALYIAAGIGSSLVAMAPDGRKAWSHPSGGKVAAIAWAPDGLRIAYVVHAGRRFVLRVTYGNGTHDVVIDRSVRPVRPSWRADSLAFAYVGAGGHAVVYDVGHQSRSVLATAASVTRLAFSPAGRALAVATRETTLLGGKTIATGHVEALGWIRGRLAVALPGAGSALVRLFSPAGAARGSHRVNGVVLAVTPKAVLARTARKLLTGRTTLMTLPRGATVRDLQAG